MQILSATGLSDADFSKILSFLQRGGVIGFPTDTAYGLAADALNEQAVSRIYEIKGRSETKPILLLVDSMEMLHRIAAPSEQALKISSLSDG